MELVRNREKIRDMQARARKLISQMTLEEKVSQMLNNAPAIERLGIRAYNWWNEALHGVARAGTATVFPQAIGLAATFDEDFIEKVAEAISTEARGKFNMQQKYEDCNIYKGLTFWSPNVNIFRDPRWGRGHETFGEDPYLTSRMGVRFVEGLQGHDENYMKAAACAKHFAVHSGPEGMRHYFDAEIDKKDLYETYLPAFKACVQEGKVEAVMGAYNRVNGEPCCGSKTLLQEILRDEWGFEGHVVSDCSAIRDFFQGHGVAADEVEAVAMAVNNGCELNCGKLFWYAVKAVQEGKIMEETIDEALVHLFTTRIKLGVLDVKEENPFDAIPYQAVDSEKMRELNRDAASRCAVLLKNEDHLLPLNPQKIKTLGIIGPNANSRKALVGNYEGTASRYFTLSEGIQEFLGNSVKVLLSEGCHLYKNREDGCNRDAEIKEICAESDVVILCLGLDANLEGEEGDSDNPYASGDKLTLNLPGIQEEILKIAYDSGKPVILVLLSGSALAIPWAEEHIPAIIQGWYPGAEGGRALAEILFGKKNPEGRLPVTFYRTTEELPDFEDYSMKGRTYRYMDQEALYPFGYGLSYTKYTYSEEKVSEKTAGENGIDVSIKVKNTGKMAGRETVQVYVKAEREGTPNAQLKGVKKIFLEPGEEKKVTFHLPPEAFALYDENGKLNVEAGTYTVYIGGSQPDRRSEKLTGKRVAGCSVSFPYSITM